jgi:DNA repair protein RadC
MTDFSFTEAPDCLAVEGEITDPDAAAFRRALVAAGAAFSRLELLELDLEDGVAVAETINALRALLDHHGSLTLLHAPQMLAHTLYKVGMLQDGRIVLVQPRVESPTVA